MPASFSNRILLFSVLSVMLLSLGACGVNKHLAPDEYLLEQNKITLKKRRSIDNNYAIRENLALFYKQQPNSNFFMIPREWFYYKYAERQDSTWWLNWVRKNAMEMPVIYDSTLTNSAARSMQNYMRNKKGYYDATVKPELLIEGKKAFVNYVITANKPYIISSIKYMFEDDILKELVMSQEEESVLTPGDILDADAFYNEKKRIIGILQNSGYAEFDGSHIQFKGDSTGHLVDIYFDILNPSPEKKHQKYLVGDVQVFTDYNPNKRNAIIDSTSLNGISYFTNREKYFVSPKMLDQTIQLKPGNLYRKQDLDLSYERLINLGPYRFTNINPKVDPQDSTRINFTVHLTPANNKWVSNYGTDIFYSTIRLASRQLFGFSGNMSFENSNLTGNAERYTFSAESTLELDIGNLRINTFGLDINNSLSIPKLVDVYKTFSLLNKSGIITEKRYNSLNNYTTTLISGGYDLSQLVTLYSINSINVSFLYSYNPNKRVGLDFRQIDLNYLLPVTELKFDTSTLNKNPLLKRSFEKVLLTGFVLGDLSYYYVSKATDRGSYWGISNTLDLSGVEIFGLNSLFNWISGKNDIWDLPIGGGESVKFSKYAKLNAEFKYHQVISSDQSLVFRIRSGLALPYGDSRAIPFVKQFYVGGPNSIRAWQIRELGPGGFDSLLVNPTPGEAFYQTGDFIFETNLEYRFPIGWIFDGALFCDAGNVWTLDKTDVRENARLHSDFYKEIAIGGGFGLRLDFSYFLLRFDFGYKLRNPYKNDAGTYWPYDVIKFNTLWRETNFNFAINYPF